MQQVLDWCIEHWSITAFCLAMFVQFTPIIKFNPLTSLCKWVGKAMTSDVMKQLEEVKLIQTSQQNTIDNNEIDRIRYEVLDFANSCRNKRKHTKDEFEHIIDLNAKYGKLLAKTGADNGVFSAEYEYILELYRTCQRENTFL